MSKPKLALIPSGYKGGDGEGTVYSILPNDASGDFDYERNGYATRVRKDGLIEELTVDDTPRLDWLNSNCPSLLLEPQRTNLILFSEQFSGTNWDTLNTTITSNTVISPNGTMTANTLQRTSTSASYRRNTISKSASAITYTTSMFIKKGSGNYFALRTQGLYPSRAIFRFRFDTEEIYNAEEFSNFTILDYGVENYSNGWYRLHFTYTSDTHTDLRIVFTPRESNGNVVAPDTSDSSYAYVWGAQTEVANYVSSYIKTEASAVTRLKDDCHLLNQTLFTDYPFTVYAKAKVDNFSNVAFSLIDSLASNKYLSIQFTSSSQIGVLRRDASNNDSDYYTFSYSIGDTLKIAISYVNDTSYKLYVNGTELADITSGLSIPFDHNDISLGQFRIASDTGTRNSIDDFRVYDYTLTDTELTELTK